VSSGVPAIIEMALSGVPSGLSATLQKLNYQALEVERVAC